MLQAQSNIRQHDGRQAFDQHPQGEVQEEEEQVVAQAQDHQEEHGAKLDVVA